MPIWFWWVSLLGWVDSRSWTASSTNSNEVFICPPHIFLRPDLFEWPSPPSALPEPKSGGCPPLNTRGSRSQIRCHPGVTFSLTDFFANPFKHLSNASSYRQRGGGNLENETACTSSIVPVDIHYASREKRTLFQTPEITLISSAQRLATSAVEIKTKKEK